MKLGTRRTLALVFVAVSAIAPISASFADTVETKLARAEDLKRVDYAEFGRLLDTLDSDSLTEAQSEELAYLRAWQTVYGGNYAAGIDQLTKLVEQAKDATVRFRSRSSLVNALGLAQRHIESFEQLNLLIEELPQQDDPVARAQALAVAAQLHYIVGQNEDSLRLSTQLLEETEIPWARCGALGIQADSGIKTGKLVAVGKDLLDAIDECTLAGEYLFAGVMRVIAAKLYLSNDLPMEAVRSLSEHETEITSTRYHHLISDMAAQLARAQLALGNLDDAKRRAQQAIDISRVGEQTEPLAQAWRVLSEVASRRGEFAEAFQALQRNAEVERAYLDEVGQRALAFQLARYRTQAQKLEIEGLNRQNDVLRLQQEVNTTAVQNARLSILLLLTVLGFAVVWALRTRKMKRHFQLLAQSDSLTGAASRPHFMNHGRQLLEKAQRSGGRAALLIMDLDFFKTVNDEHGHAVRDEMLRRAADCCRETLAPHGLFGRLGGEEFGFILPGKSADEAVDLANDCRLAVHTIQYGSSEQPSYLSASFGVTSTAEEGFDMRDLLVAADGALYEAKRKGRNRVVHRQRRRSEAWTPAAV